MINICLYLNLKVCTIAQIAMGAKNEQSVKVSIFFLINQWSETICSKLSKGPPSLMTAKELFNLRKLTVIF